MNDAPNIQKSAKLFQKVFQPLLFLMLVILMAEFWPKIFMYFNVDLSGFGAKFLSYAMPCLAWILAAWLVNGLVEVFLWERILQNRLKVTIPTLIKEMVKIIVYFAMILFISTNVFNFSVNGFLAASGLIGLIIGFAIKNLIAELFNGLALNFDHPFTPGEFIALQIPEVKGVLKVLDTTWRTTRFETESNNLLVVPNSKLGAMVITNLSKNSQGSFNFTLQIESDVPTKRAITLLEAAVKSSQGVLFDPEPEIVISALKNNAVTYKIIYWLAPNKILPSTVKNSIMSHILNYFNLAGFTLVKEVFTHTSQNLSSPIAPLIFLQRIELFQSLSDSEKDDLIEKLKVRHYSKKSTIVELNVPGDSLFIVAEGLVNVWIKPSEEMNFIVTARLGTGEYFGEMSLLAGEPRSAQITAETDVILYEITKEAIEPILKTHPQLVEQFSEIIARRQELNQQEKLKALPNSDRKEQHLSNFQKILQKIKGYFRIES